MADQPAATESGPGGSGEEEREVSLLIPLDDDEAIQALSKYKRISPACRPGDAAA